MRRSREAVAPGPGAWAELPCACATARRISRLLTQMYDAHLRPAGLESTQFGLLSALSGAGPCSQAAIGQRFGFDKSTLSRNLKVLRARGWIELAPGVDGRERLCQLTAAGRERVKTARPAWRRAQQALRRSLGAGEWDAMWSAFRTVSVAARAAHRDGRSPSRGAGRRRPTQ